MQNFVWLWLWLCCALCCLLQVLSAEDLSSWLFFDRVYVEFGTNIGQHVSQRIFKYLRAVESGNVRRIGKKRPWESNDDVGGHGNSLVLSFGNTTRSLSAIPKNQLNALHSESFRLQLTTSVDHPNVYFLACNGLPLDPATHQNVSFDKQHIHYGAVVGAYAALEEVGFSFLHPLQPYIPSQIRILLPSIPAAHTRNISGSTEQHVLLDRTESPYWPERAFHIHTQHPLELTEVLQGHDIPQFGPHGPSCKHFSKLKPLDDGYDHSLHRPVRSAYSDSTEPHTSAPKPKSSAGESQHTYCERWEDMVSDVDYLFEWSVANRLNKIEWLLLGSYKWGDEWSTRRRRLKTLVKLGHQYSLLIGVDVPLGNIQQHGWYMVNVRLPFPQQALQIKSRVDWILSAGFDFLTTESGLSEFTHPECDHMLDLMNVFAEHVNGTWGREAGIKVHCSTGQKCEDYKDPRTGEPINFNFLPTFAHKGMGVFPHTVQVYALDDPTAFAYGNENFSYVEDYIVYEAKQHNRSVTFYGETAYWVNVDIDVPLFLPLYGQRRQHDLRRLAVREHRENFRIDGQVNFDSGWEWGYWLSDVVTARASWDPLLPFVSGDGRSNNSKSNGDGSGGGDNGKRDNKVNNSDGIGNGSSETSVSGGSFSVEGGDVDDSCADSKYNENNMQDKEGSTNHDTTMKPTLPVDYQAQQDQWTAFSTAIKPYTKIYGSLYGEKLNKILVRLAQQQAELLVHGRINGKQSPDLRKLGGMAYLSGGDTWVDIPRMLGIPFTQPDKVHIKENADPHWKHVLKLLQAMQVTFVRLSGEMDRLVDEIQMYVDAQSVLRIGDSASDTASISTINTDGTTTTAATASTTSKSLPHFEINPEAMVFLSEIQDCIKLLSLRSQQVQRLYQSRDVAYSSNTEGRAELQRQARALVHQAEEVVSRREAAYRVPWQRVADWRENPTVYRFGYLWAVHSLYYWWRDQGLAEQGSLQSEHSPCYLNRMDPTEVAVGWGKYTLEVLRAFINRYTPFSVGSPLEVVNCLSPPVRGYEFPKDLYHL